MEKNPTWYPLTLDVFVEFLYKVILFFIFLLIFIFLFDAFSLYSSVFVLDMWISPPRASGFDGGTHPSR